MNKGSATRYLTKTKKTGAFQPKKAQKKFTDILVFFVKGKPLNIVLSFQYNNIVILE
jgi:hypothetical protein